MIPKGTGEKQQAEQERHSGPPLGGTKGKGKENKFNKGSQKGKAKGKGKARGADRSGAKGHAAGNA